MVAIGLPGGGHRTANNALAMFRAIEILLESTDPDHYRYDWAGGDSGRGELFF